MNFEGFTKPFFSGFETASLGILEGDDSSASVLEPGIRFLLLVLPSCCFFAAMGVDRSSSSCAISGVSGSLERLLLRGLLRVLESIGPIDK